MAKQIATLFFLVEENTALLNAFAEYNTARRETERVNKSIADQLGAKQGRIDQVTGCLTGLVLPKNTILPGMREFKKPDKHGVSYPKFGSEWEKVFRAIPAVPNASEAIAQVLGIPTHLAYKTKVGNQYAHMGNPLRECGWLLSGSQLGFWVPNVPGYVEAVIEQGGVIADESVLSIKMEFPGCKQIHEAEWDLIVATNKVNKIKESEAENATEPA